ncbi:MAG: phosphomannomutase [Campylobacterales bacterium]
MKTFTINNQTFNIKEIKQLYPAVLVKTGYKDETTPMSLEWIDTEAKGRVETAGYVITLITTSDDKYNFTFRTRDELNLAMKNLANQLN